MQQGYTISKTNYESMMKLVDRAIEIIKASKPKPRDYNVARQLYIIKKKIEKKNGKG